jgi:hypothetical protein
MYCSQLWRPCLIKDIIRIESVQRRSTKFILSYAPINYKDRLIQLQILPYTPIFLASVLLNSLLLPSPFTYVLHHHALTLSL